MARHNDTAKEIDLNAGAFLKKRRVEMGMSRTQLAKVIGVSHQQMQKYEKGENRISIGRLYQLAKALNTPTAAFLPDESVEMPSIHMSMAINVSRNFMKIKCPNTQRDICRLVGTLARSES